MKIDTTDIELKALHVGTLAMNLGVLEIGTIAGGRRIATVESMGLSAKEVFAYANAFGAAKEMLDALESFPDLHDGRMTETELLDACRDWFWGQAESARRKARGLE